MLTLDSGAYFVPVYDEEYGVWNAEDRNGNIMMIMQPFRYTALVEKEGKMNRFTFDIEGASVKPNMRTLRVYGSGLTSWMVKQIRFSNSDANRRLFLYDPDLGNINIYAVDVASATT